MKIARALVPTLGLRQRLWMAVAPTVRVTRQSRRRVSRRLPHSTNTNRITISKSAPPPIYIFEFLLVARALGSKKRRMYLSTRTQRGLFGGAQIGSEAMQ